MRFTSPSRSWLSHTDRISHLHCRLNLHLMEIRPVTDAQMTAESTAKSPTPLALTTSCSGAIETQMARMGWICRRAYKV